MCCQQTCERQKAFFLPQKDRILEQGKDAVYKLLNVGKVYSLLSKMMNKKRRGGVLKYSDSLKLSLENYTINCKTNGKGRSATER